MKSAKSTRPQAATAITRHPAAISAPPKPKAPRRAAPVASAAIAAQEQEIRARLLELVTPEEAERWLHAPQARFGDKTPLQLIARGQGLRVLQEIVYVDEVAQV